MHGLPVTAAVREVLALLQLRLHQGTADTGVAVSVHPLGEPRARDAGLGGVAVLDHAVVSVAPFLHCFNDVRLSTPVLLLVSRCRQWVVLTWQICLSVMSTFRWDQLRCNGSTLSVKWQVGMKKAGSSGPPHPSFLLEVSRTRIRSSAGREPKGSERTLVDLCG